VKPTRIDVDLDEALRRFIDGEVAEGRFQSANDVIEAALQLLQEREGRLATLRSLMPQSEPKSRRSPEPP
jgi:antitoxin ParD1/3/4